MRLEDLERELRAERPELDPDFARKLDDWAAAGFPRGGELDPRSPRGRAEDRFPAAFRRAWERLTAVPPRRLLAPVAAAATVIVIGGVVVTQGVDLGGNDRLASQSSGDAGSAAPATEQRQGAADEEAAVEKDVAPDESQLEAPTAGEAASGGADAAVAPASPESFAPPSDGGGGVARGTDDRLVDASARLSLGAEADEVQEVANGVVQVADRHDGIVLDSQVTNDQGGARAAFSLEIPFTELDAALTDLSELGDVISRTEEGEDITQRYVRAQRELARTHERIGELRVDLIEADSREERLVIKSQIDSLQAQADAYESQRNNVEREARFATVDVAITSDGPESEDDGWSLGDAVDDAGDVLTVVGGVALITLAVVVPIGLVVALIFWVVTRTQRTRRERALDH
jgi:hypothetical protein